VGHSGGQVRPEDRSTFRRAVSVVGQKGPQEAAPEQLPGVVEIVLLWVQERAPTCQSQRELGDGHPKGASTRDAFRRGLRPLGFPRAARRQKQQRDRYDRGSGPHSNPAAAAAAPDPRHHPQLLRRVAKYVAAGLSIAASHPPTAATSPTIRANSAYLFHRCRAQETCDPPASSATWLGSQLDTWPLPAQTPVPDLSPFVRFSPGAPPAKTRLSKGSIPPGSTRSLTCENSLPPQPPSALLVHTTR
jgi:hypothetical protein